MTRLTLRRFDIVRTANIVAVLYAMIFAVFGLVFLLPSRSSAGSRAAGRAARGSRRPASSAGSSSTWSSWRSTRSRAGSSRRSRARRTTSWPGGSAGIRVDVIAEGPSGGVPGVPGGLPAADQRLPAGLRADPGPGAQLARAGVRPAPTTSPSGTLPPPPA